MNGGLSAKPRAQDAKQNTEKIKERESKKTHSTHTRSDSQRTARKYKTFWLAECSTHTRTHRKITSEFKKDRKKETVPTVVDPLQSLEDNTLSNTHTHHSYSTTFIRIRGSHITDIKPGKKGYNSLSPPILQQNRIICANKDQDNSRTIQQTQVQKISNKNIIPNSSVHTRNRQ